MVLYFNGDFSKDVGGGKTVHFRRNMAAFTLFGDLQNISIPELAQELVKPRFSTLANFLYACAAVYCRQEKVKQDFTQDDASDWLNVIGFDYTWDVFSECFKSPEEKNPEAPQTVGQSSE